MDFTTDKLYKALFVNSMEDVLNFLIDKALLTSLLIK